MCYYVRVIHQLTLLHNSFSILSYCDLLLLIRYNTAQSSLGALLWTRIIIKRGPQNMLVSDSALFTKLVESQAMLLASVTAVGFPK